MFCFLLHTTTTTITASTIPTPPQGLSWLPTIGGGAKEQFLCMYGKECLSIASLAPTPSGYACRQVWTAPQNGSGDGLEAAKSSDIVDVSFRGVCVPSFSVFFFFFPFFVVADSKFKMSSRRRQALTFLFAATEFSLELHAAQKYGRSTYACC